MFIIVFFCYRSGSITNMLRSSCSFTRAYFRGKVTRMANANISTRLLSNWIFVGTRYTEHNPRVAADHSHNTTGQIGTAVKHSPALSLSLSLSLVLEDILIGFCGHEMNRTCP